MGNELDVKKIQDAVREKYAEITSSAEAKFNYPTGKNGAMFTVMIRSHPEDARRIVKVILWGGESLLR